MLLFQIHMQTDLIQLFNTKLSAKRSPDEEKKSEKLLEYYFF